MGGGTPRDEEYDQGGGGLCGRGRDVRKGSEKAEVEGEKEEEEAEKEEEEKEGGGRGWRWSGGIVVVVVSHCIYSWITSMTNELPLPYTK